MRFSSRTHTQLLFNWIDLNISPSKKLLFLLLHSFSSPFPLPPPPLIFLFLFSPLPSPSISISNIFNTQPATSPAWSLPLSGKSRVNFFTWISLPYGTNSSGIQNLLTGIISSRTYKICKHTHILSWFCVQFESLIFNCVNWVPRHFFILQSSPSIWFPSFTNGKCCHGTYWDMWHLTCNIFVDATNM